MSIEDEALAWGDGAAAGGRENILADAAPRVVLVNLVVRVDDTAWPRPRGGAARPPRRR